MRLCVVRARPACQVPDQLILERPAPRALVRRAGPNGKAANQGGLQVLLDIRIAKERVRLSRGVVGQRRHHEHVVGEEIHGPEIHRPAGAVEPAVHREVAAGAQRGDDRVAPGLVLGGTVNQRLLCEGGGGNGGKAEDESGPKESVAHCILGYLQASEIRASKVETLDLANTSPGSRTSRTRARWLARRDALQMEEAFVVSNLIAATATAAGFTLEGTVGRTSFFSRSSPQAARISRDSNTIVLRMVRSQWGVPTPRGGAKSSRAAGQSPATTRDPDFANRPRDRRALIPS